MHLLYSSYMFSKNNIKWLLYNHTAVAQCPSYICGRCERITVVRLHLKIVIYWFKTERKKVRLEIVSLPHMGPKKKKNPYLIVNVDLFRTARWPYIMTVVYCNQNIPQGEMATIGWRVHWDSRPVVRRVGHVFGWPSATGCGRLIRQCSSYTSSVPVHAAYT